MMNKIVFLDRDGTLNEEVYYLHRPEDLKLLPDVPEALALLKQAGFRLIVVTNQAGVARGYYTEEDVRSLHRYMNRILEEKGAAVDAFYYCPHHPEHGIGPYRVNCSCRKPGVGMFEQAARDFAVDKAASFMIGDKLLDVEAGKRFGLTSILVGTGYGRGLHEEDVRENRTPGYDYYADTLLSAAEWITGVGRGSAIIEGGQCVEE